MYTTNGIPQLTFGKLNIYKHFHILGSPDVCTLYCCLRECLRADWFCIVTGMDVFGISEGMKISVCVCVYVCVCVGTSGTLHAGL